jgi:2,3-bisphosphoglycerate-dependent phosphoglycerate mutase
MLILLRHGQSVFNKENIFTGWIDIPLSQEGIEESLQAAEALKGVEIDVVFSASLIRCQMTVPLALIKSKKIPVFLHPGEGRMEEWGQVYSEETKKRLIPVYSAWELNERMYGHLQGLNKAETAKKFGNEQVHTWRRSYDGRPPEGESLAMTAARTWPYFQKTILPYLEKGKTVLICAHGNSIRAITMHLENLSKEAVAQLEIPTGKPLFYSYDKGQWHKK